LDKALIDTPMMKQRSALVWHHDGLQHYFTQRFEVVSHLICVMPGSRRSEITAILPPMLEGIQKLLILDPELCFIIPTVDQNHQYIVQDIVDSYPEAMQQAIVVVYDASQPNFSQQAMAAADLILLASGTATLEAMLLERPMVVMYQLNNLTYQIAKRLVKVPYVALPNILAQEMIVPELIQEDANGANISRTIKQQLQSRAYEEQLRALIATKAMLEQQSNHSPADSVIEAWYLHEHAHRRSMYK